MIYNTHTTSAFSISDRTVWHGKCEGKKAMWLSSVGDSEGVDKTLSICLLGVALGIQFVWVKKDDT